MKKTNFHTIDKAYAEPEMAVQFICVDSIICISNTTAEFTVIEEDLPIELF